MLNQKLAINTYRSASRYRSQREQEADVFRQVNATLGAARDANAVRRVRALADNRLLWGTVTTLMRDPANRLPDSLKSSLISLGLAVEREMDQENPDFNWLISINELIASGLSGNTAG
ncbi:MAG TPA: flagellar biosynthesis regulator FlaF [Rhodopila sp.]|nr:flagellar biosynthesis regulator FlaF [Rhodopila sp.]